MKKGLKKMLSCLTAAVIVMSTLPFATVSAQAATSTATVKGYCTFKGHADSNRIDGTTLKICNDNTKENFTIGFVNFDVSNVSCSASDIVSANYTYTVKMDTNCNDNEGLSIYYPLINTDDFLNYTSSSTYSSTGAYLHDVNQTSYNAIYTGGTDSKNTGADFIGHSKTNYMLQLIAEYDTNPTTATTKTIDIGPAIKAAKLAGKSTATICFMLKNAGDTDNGSGDNAKGWSDTAVTVSTDSVSVNTSSANYSSIKSNISSKINQTKTFGSDVYKNNADSNYMKGVKISGDWQDESDITLSPNNIDFKVTGFANQVAVYTGSGSDIRFPFIARNVANKAASSTMLIHYVSYTSSNFEVGGGTWTRCSDYNNFTSSSDTSHDFSSVNGTSKNTNGAKFYTTDGKAWKNYITYCGSGNTTDYYDKLSSFSFNLKYYTSSAGNSSEHSIANSKASLYVINYAPIKALIENSEFKTKYNSISANESIYETNSLTNYYNAVNDLLNFDVLDGITASNASTTVPQKGAKIKELLEEYNSAVDALTYNYTFQRTDGTSVTVAVKDESSAYKWGVTNANASNNADSAKTYKSNKQHAWNSYSWASTASNYVFTEVATEHTEDCTISAGGKCSGCGEQLLALEAYNAAYASAYLIISNIISESNEYTPASSEEYKTLFNEAVALKNNATTQAEIDQATAQLISAKSVLRKQESTVTVQKVADDSTEAETIKTETAEYGTELTIDLTSEIGENSVQKWIVTTDDGSTTTAVNTTDKKITLVVTKDVKVTVYTVTNPTSETKKYSKVVFLGKNGRVVDVKYVEEGVELPTSEVSVPTIPFYSPNGWDKATVTGTGSDIYVRANYTSTISDDWCVVHYIDKNGNDTTQKYSYDSYAKVPDDIEGDSFALAKDKDGTDILTYLDGRDFYVPYIKDIYVVPVSNKQAQIAVTGSFSGLNSETNMKYATFNCKFYLPDGCKVVEWGAEISAGGRTQVVKGEKLSKGNEYSITMNINSATSITAFTGVAYVTYTDASGPHTLKSAPVEQSLN